MVALHNVLVELAQDLHGVQKLGWSVMTLVFTYYLCNFKINLFST